MPLRHPDRRSEKRADGPARATPWGITRPAHAVWSTARESNPALLLGRQGPSRSDSGTGRDKRGSAHRESNPVPLTGSQACSRKHLARVELRAGLAPAWDEVAARRLSLRSSGAERKREESNLRDTWSGRLATGCAKPTCTSLPSTTSQHRAVSPPEAIRTPEPGFVVLAAVHLPGGLIDWSLRRVWDLNPRFRLERAASSAD